MGEIMKSNNKQEIRCTMCNKVFDMWDIQEDFSLQRWIGYGSIHDMEYLDMQFCCDCFDKKIMPFILKNSVNNPLTDYQDEQLPNGSLRRFLVDKNGKEIKK